MKIGYDAKRAFLNTTGLGNYSRWLIKAMSVNQPGNTYYLYTPSVKANTNAAALNDLPNLKTAVPKGKTVKSWWRSRGILVDLVMDGIDVYHGLSHELPFGIEKTGIRSAVTIHDLIFLRFPGEFGWVSRKIYFLKVRRACRAANRIIAISNQTKKDLVDLFGLEPSTIQVIYQGCDDIFKATQSPQVKEAVRLKYKLPADFILNVGTIEARKNVLVLVKALEHTTADVSLVIVGRPTAYLKIVQRYISSKSLNRRVIFIHDAGINELAALYQLAKIFCYPSFFEGFGLPVLEAITSGTPVIAATGSCLEEAGGPGSMYTSPDDEQALSAKIDQLYSNKPLRDDMIASGLQYAKRFNAEKLGNELQQLYYSL